MDNTIIKADSARGKGLINGGGNKPDIKKKVVIWAVLIAAFFIIGFLIPDVENMGVLTILPSAFLLFYIFWTKRILESLVLGSIFGFILAYKGGFFWPWSDALLETMINEDIGWLFIVCGLMGSLIALIERAGGAYAFGNFVAKRAKTEKGTLLWSWLLGVVIFIDDYLNSLTVGSSMAPCTDKHKVPREMLAYVVDSTAAPVCLLVPISTWAIFIGSLIEQQGLAADGDGLKYFIGSIPYNFYAWAAALIVPLVIIGIIPIFGPMKGAYKRAKETGQLAPEGSEKIDIRGDKEVKIPENPKLMNFFVPIIVLVAATILTDVDMQAGILITLAFTFFFYIFQGIMDEMEFFDLVIEGVKNMLLPLIMVVLAYMFAAGNEAIGFLDYVITTATANVTPQMLPLVVFIVLGITEFIMGLSWGMYVIAIPMVIPVALNLGVNPAIVIGAVAAAGGWGSHICFYSDATILTSAATGCDNLRHAFTQAPYGILGAMIASIAFLITGFVAV
ncbi:MAG TPA: sodium:proton antiporter [Spirochaeta sp.]|nr:sodium:proton antiporter [Spirochaeta sp.]